MTNTFPTAAFALREKKKRANKTPANLSNSFFEPNCLYTLMNKLLMAYLLFVKIKKPSHHKRQLGH
jgi:hypothetical protein